MAKGLTVARGIELAHQPNLRLFGMMQEGPMPSREPIHVGEGGSEGDMREEGASRQGWPEACRR